MYGVPSLTPWVEHLHDVRAAHASGRRRLAREALHRARHRE
jgi:hypothetical protein